MFQHNLPLPHSSYIYFTPCVPRQYRVQYRYTHGVVPRTKGGGGLASRGSRTGGDPLLDHASQHAVGCQLGAREQLRRLVGRVAAPRIHPARNRLKIIGGPLRRYSWLAHEAHRQRADELSRGGVVAVEVVKRLGDDEGRRPVLGPIARERVKVHGTFDEGSWRHPVHCVVDAELNKKTPDDIRPEDGPPQLVHPPQVWQLTLTWQYCHQPQLHGLNERFNQVKTDDRHGNASVHCGVRREERGG
eukprot:scaffold15145_cov54-Phaeocystis_antarctica.AAC.1